MPICHASHTDALEDILTLSTDMVSGVCVSDPGLGIWWWQGLLSSAMFKSQSTMQVSW